MNKQMVFTGIKWCLVNLLKLSGWQVFLIMHVADALWKSVIAPFLANEKRWAEHNRRVKRRQELVKKVKETHHHKPLLEQTKAMLSAMGVKKWEDVK